MLNIHRFANSVFDWRIFAILCACCFRFCKRLACNVQAAIMSFVLFVLILGLQVGTLWLRRPSPSFEFFPMAAIFLQAWHNKVKFIQWSVSEPGHWDVAFITHFSKFFWDGFCYVYYCFGFETLGATSMVCVVFWVTHRSAWRAWPSTDTRWIYFSWFRAFDAGPRQVLSAAG